VTEISKSFTFEAAHLLPNAAPDHKCARLHGHSFGVELHVGGPVDPELGWVVDFAEIAAAWRPLHDQLDHRYLNEVEGLDNPTSERIAEWIWTRVRPTLAGLVRVVVRETCTASCTYTG